MSLSVEPSQAVNVADVIKGIWRRKLLLLTLIVIGALLGATIVFTSKPTYQSEAQIIIENTATSYERANSDLQNAATAPVDERLITSQVSVIKSGDLFGRVVDQLGLDTPEIKKCIINIHRTVRQNNG